MGAVRDFDETGEPYDDGHVEGEPLAVKLVVARLDGHSLAGQQKDDGPAGRHDA